MALMTAISNSFCKHFRLASITHSPSLSPLSKVNLQFTPRSRYPQKFSWTRKSNLTNLQLFKSYTVYGKSQQNPEAWQSSNTSLSLILLLLYKIKNTRTTASGSQQQLQAIEENQEGTKNYTRHLL